MLALDTSVAHMNLEHKKIFTIVAVEARSKMLIRAIFAQSNRPVCVSEDDLRLLPGVWASLPPRDSRIDTFEGLVNVKERLVLPPVPFSQNQANMVRLVTDEDLRRHEKGETKIEWSDTCMGARFLPLSEDTFCNLISDQCSRI